LSRSGQGDRSGTEQVKQRVDGVRETGGRRKAIGALVGGAGRSVSRGGKGLEQAPSGPCTVD